ncbi:MAG TPA: hypothetical protein VHH36_05895 [Candidatus Thermoplasmatota archaeon]|nr:hypothetical protein [Candidatus Thermoplasmatota archaeon]
MLRVAVLIAVVAAAFVAAPATLADHPGSDPRFCHWKTSVSNSTQTITYYDLSRVPGFTGLYYINKTQQHTQDLDFFVYNETNGKAGLQRYDDERDDVCKLIYAPDTLVYQKNDARPHELSPLLRR